MINTDVFVIGAGLSGLTLANTLAQAGVDVCVAEKARGSGGRLSSKRIQFDDQTIGFDLGASAITAKTDAFKQMVAMWQQQGVIDHWLSIDETPYYVGTPRSSSVTRHLANQVDVHFSAKVQSVIPAGDQWQIMLETNQGPVLFAQANHVVYASPAEQTFNLLPTNHELKKVIEPAHINSQWAMMVALPEALDINDLVLNATDKIQSISYENSKPKRTNELGLHVYCVQASTEFSKGCINEQPESVKGDLLNDLAAYLGISLTPVTNYIHRWLYSHGSENGHVDAGYLTADDGISICGDYLLGDMSIKGAEAAALSGLALGDYLVKCSSILSEVG